MKFAVVYWVKTKNWSVVSCKDIVGEMSVGANTYVTWKGKPYETRILRLSDSREELSNLKVTDDGFIREFGDTASKTKDHAMSKPGAKQMKKVKSSGIQGLQRRKLKPVYEQDPDSPDEASLPSVQVSSGPEGWDASSSKSAEDVEHHVSVQKASPTAGAPAASKDVLDDELVLGPASKSTTEIVIAPVTPQGTTNMLHMAATAPMLPTPSEEVLTYLESFVAFYRTDGRSLSLSSQHEKSGQSHTPKSHELIELLPGHSRAKISRQRRHYITKLHKENPSKMATSLLLELMGEESLKKHSARGQKKSQFPGIDPALMSAVEEYVALHSTSAFTKKDMTKATNNLCDTLRNPSRSHAKNEEKKCDSKRVKKQNSKSDGDGPSPSGPEQAVFASPQNSPWKVTSVTKTSAATSELSSQNSPWKVISITETSAATSDLSPYRQGTPSDHGSSASDNSQAKRNKLSVDDSVQQEQVSRGSSAVRSLDFSNRNQYSPWYYNQNYSMPQTQAYQYQHGNYQYYQPPHDSALYQTPYPNEQYPSYKQL